MKPVFQRQFTYLRFLQRLARAALQGRLTPFGSRRFPGFLPPQERQNFVFSRGLPRHVKQ